MSSGVPVQQSLGSPTLTVWTIEGGSSSWYLNVNGQRSGPTARTFNPPGAGGLGTMCGGTPPAGESWRYHAAFWFPRVLSVQEIWMIKKAAKEVASFMPWS